MKKKCFNCDGSNNCRYINPNGLCNKCQYIYDKKLTNSAKKRNKRRTPYPFGFEYTRGRK